MPSRSQALPGSGLLARLCLAEIDWRQSLQSSAFPGRAWERENEMSEEHRAHFANASTAAFSKAGRTLPPSMPG